MFLLSITFFLVLVILKAHFWFHNIPQDVEKTFKKDYKPLTAQIAGLSEVPLYMYHICWNNNLTQIESIVNKKVVENRLSTPSLQFSIHCIAAHAFV